MRLAFLVVILALLTTGCEKFFTSVPTQGPSPVLTPFTTNPTPTPTLPTTPTSQIKPGTTMESDVDDLTGSPIPTLDPQHWQDWPVIPAMTTRSYEIWVKGQASGLNPRAFSKLGDCETDTDWFLTNFDKSEAYYNLGPFKDQLADVIGYFQGSFSRRSLAAHDGGTAATLLNPMWSNQDLCKTGETPLDCEVRLHRPAFALISVGTNDTVKKDRFESNMRLVIERLIELGVVPILVTKADNLEGDNSINLTIARLASEYDLMLWNFWSAVQPLPNHGLLEDKAHLSWARNDFSDPKNLEKAWPIRNLTALQLLDMIQESLNLVSN